MQIRRFRPEDLAALTRLTREALREEYPPSLFVDIHRSWREGFLVAEEDGPVAFLAAIQPGPGRARILLFVTDTAHRRRGIGSALMDRFLAGCRERGVTAVELEVRKSNVDAIRFYSRFGFAIVETVPAFYTDGEDAYRMRLAVAPTDTPSVRPGGSGSSSGRGSPTSGPR